LAELAASARPEALVPAVEEPLPDSFLVRPQLEWAVQFPLASVLPDLVVAWLVPAFQLLAREPA
jgi:hypothetical protein